MPSPHLSHYLDWITNGLHGDMRYMSREDRVARRKDLQLILPGAKSLIMVAVDYYRPPLPESIVSDPRRGRISNYAWGADYHEGMLEGLELLATYVGDLFANEVASRAYVDTGAILERSHAQQAGLGFFGKNTLLIHPRRGSYFFLGEIITTAVLEHEESPPMPGCGSCARCLTACPTAAFPQPYVLDSKRCISYLTTEHKEFIPRELRPLMGNWVYGCDICQEACPWQRFAPVAVVSDSIQEQIDRIAPALDELLLLDRPSFHAKFANSAIFRIGRDRMVRNACIAAGNSADSIFGALLSSLLADSSALVRGHAAWALGQLDTQQEVIRQRLPQETDPKVVAEFEAALSVQLHGDSNG